MPPRLIAAPPKQPYTNGDLIPFPSEFWGSPVLTDAEGRPYCPGFLGNTFTSNQWDTVVIGIPLPFMTGILAELNVDRFPGICEVNVRRGRKVDRKKSAGSDGQRLTFTGIDNADVDINVTIWTPEQFDVLGALWNIIQPPVGKGTPHAFQVKHPNLSQNNVSSVCFVDSVGFTDGRSPMTKVFSIKAIEYFPPGSKKTTATIDRTLVKDSTFDEQFPKPGSNPENMGPK